ncbi:hypothetical protein EC957_007943 [Mortierella hygrophila]|uniref:Uncharacterized protein n=1 Tax=Mortierella hygrophila TaxID=979708 RepID=A0A9P6JY49_9FUNG|nr:hypothetical protein EC957_007943 [Mortierella hygrophila]
MHLNNFRSLQASLPVLNWYQGAAKWLEKNREWAKRSWKAASQDIKIPLLRQESMYNRYSSEIDVGAVFFKSACVPGPLIREKILCMPRQNFGAALQSPSWKL